MACKLAVKYIIPGNTLWIVLRFLTRFWRLLIYLLEDCQLFGNLNFGFSNFEILSFEFWFFSCFRIFWKCWCHCEFVLLSARFKKNNNSRPITREWKQKLDMTWWNELRDHDLQIKHIRRIMSVNDWYQARSKILRLVRKVKFFDEPSFIGFQKISI